MRHFQNILLAFLFCLALSCQQKTDATTEIKTVKQDKGSSPKDSLSLNLVSLQQQGKLPKTSVITVSDDPVYHRVKHYNAFSLPQLLNTYTSVKNLETHKYQIVFECEDGYKPMMPLDTFLMAKSFIAISDVDAPKGKLWSDIIKDGHPMKAAPFYLIYQGISAKDANFKWPYNLIKIQIIPEIENMTILAPEDPKAQAGFELFTKHCVTCHAINKIGGTMGPELNYPKNVTEYWKEQQLRDFILNPASFRHGVKMPKIVNLSPKEIDEIIVYLHDMSEHKLQ